MKALEEQPAGGGILLNVSRDPSDTTVTCWVLAGEVDEDELPGTLKVMPAATHVSPGVETGTVWAAVDTVAEYVPGTCNSPFTTSCILVE